MFEINRGLNAETLEIGNERTPVFIVDDFMLDIEPARQEAIALDYSDDKEHIGAYYPGIRAPVGGDYGMAVLRYVANILYKLFQVPDDLTMYPLNGSYSLITTRNEDMNLLQCIPHYDNTKPCTYAVIHHLNDGEFGGTGFYRHRPTGFENVTEERKQQYFDSAQAFIDTHGNPERKHMTESTDHFELIHKIDYRPNRLAIYPSTVLHSAYIDKPERDINPDPRTGRLSANFFIEFRRD